MITRRQSIPSPIIDREEFAKLPVGAVVRDVEGAIGRKYAAEDEHNRSYVWQVLGDDRNYEGGLDFVSQGYFYLPVNVLWPTS